MGFNLKKKPRTHTHCKKYERKTEILQKKIWRLVFQNCLVEFRIWCTGTFLDFRSVLAVFRIFCNFPVFFERRVDARNGFCSTLRLSTAAWFSNFTAKLKTHSILIPFPIPRHSALHFQAVLSRSLNSWRGESGESFGF